MRYPGSINKSCITLFVFISKFKMPVEITLKKSEFNIPWGFRLHGGKDFGAPLTVQRIKPLSLASKSGLTEGDNISMINSETTHGLKHTEAQELIKKGGCHLNLIICRGDEIVVKHNKNAVDNHNYQTNLPQVKVETEVSHSISTSNNCYNAPLSAKPFKASSNITSNNSSLYKPSMQTLTSGLTNLQTDDDDEGFPPPPPSPHQLMPIQTHPEVHVTTVDGDVNTSRLISSETLKLVKEIDSGAEIPFSPKTGAGVKSSPIQSRLMGILEKKHGLVQYESQQDGGVGYRAYSAPKSPLTTSDYKANNAKNRSNDFKSPSNTTNNNSLAVSFNQATPSQFQGPTQPSNHLHSTSPYQRSPSPSQPSNFPHQPTNSPHQPPSHHSSQSRKILDSLDKGGVPNCHVCNAPVRGPYVLAINKIWCPEHFVCSNATCQKPLSNTGFVEEGGKLYCKEDYERYMAPKCDKCSKPIVGNTVKALNGSYHPECFMCQQCHQPIAGGVFHMHEGKVYCDKDFSALFATKCVGCKFAIEVGDNWIEAAGTNWHGECFNCSVCKTNLQKTGFVHRSGRFLCKEHARMP